MKAFATVICCTIILTCKHSRMRKSIRHCQLAAAARSVHVGRSVPLHVLPFSSVKATNTAAFIAVNRHGYR